MLPYYILETIQELARLTELLNTEVEKAKSQGLKIDIKGPRNCPPDEQESFAIEVYVNWTMLAPQ